MSSLPENLNPNASEIALRKAEFLKIVEVDSADQATGNAMRASLRRNPTYGDLVFGQSQFRHAFENAILGYGRTYSERVDDAKHLNNIETISQQLSLSHGAILAKSVSANRHCSEGP